MMCLQLVYHGIKHHLILCLTVNYFYIIETHKAGLLLGECHWSI